MTLRDSIEIDAPAERVFTFFDAMAENYTRWHPDHLDFRWLEGGRVEPGAVFWFEERIAGKNMRKTVRFTRVVRGRYMEFTPTSRFIRLFMPRLSFATEPTGPGSCRFTAEIYIRTGPIGAWLNRREFDAVRRHMREEGENLKRLVETQMDAAP